MSKNFFSLLGLEIAMNLDISELDLRYQNALLKCQNVEEKIDTTQAYNALRNKISRGEHILKIMKIQYESITIPEYFFENIIECDTEERRRISHEIYEDLIKIDVLSEDVDKFAIKFLMYKYVANHL